MKSNEKGKGVLNEFQVSMTEWFAAINDAKQADAFRKEDNTKDERLETLYQTIRLQYERPTTFEADDLIKKSKEFLEFFKDNSSKLCALRLMSKDPSLPKLRNRGLTVKEVYEKWFSEQKIDHSKYVASFRPHAGTYPLSLIMVVTDKGIFGEAVVGQHAQLTQGATNSKTSQFSYDFRKWQWKNKTKKAEEVVKRILKTISVKDSKKRNLLAKKLKAKFAQNFLKGYFEAILWSDGVIRFSDFNRLLHQGLEKPNLRNEKGLSGTSVFAGKVSGKVVIVKPEDISKKEFKEGSILVTDNTDVRFLPLMKKAAAIVTDRGGILSHAAIVARELKKPCIVGTKVATKILKDEDLVEVDAQKGVVRKN